MYEQIKEKLLYLKSKLFKTGFFHIFGSNVVNKVVNFLSSAILVRVLSKPEYGKFTYIWNLYGFVLLFNGFGLVSGVLQLCSEHSEDTDYSKRIVSTGSKYGIIFDLFLAGLILIGSYIYPFKIENSGSLFRLLVFLPMLQLLFDITCAFLRAIKDNKTFSLLSVMDTVFIALFCVSGVFFLREKGMIIGRYFAYALTLAFGFLFFKINIFNSNGEISEQDKSSLFKISIVSMANNGISEFLYLLDIYLLGLVTADPEILANYRVATQIPTALIFIPSAIVTYIYPYFAQHREDKKWCLDHYKKMIFYIGLMNLSISLVLILFAKPIFFFLYGPKYYDAIVIFRLLAFNYFISGTFRIISGNLLVTQRKLKFNFYVSTICGLINAFADYYMIKMWGSIGASMATVLVVLISSIMSTTYLIYTFKH